MPRERIEFTRKSNIKDVEKLFILSYEGRRSEKKYFNDFRKSKYFNDSGLIEIVALKQKENQGTDPFSVKKLLDEVKAEFSFKDSDEFWLIVDFDNWEETHNINLTQLVEECKAEQNFFLAMSNPCFEFWLLLHLKKTDDYDNETLQLILENKKISAKKNYIDIVLGEAQNNGRGYNKKPNPKIFLPKIHDAIRRAKSLHLESEDYPTKLGSDVFKLMEKLVRPLS